MSMYDGESVGFGLDKGVFPEIVDLKSPDVPDISDSNAAENTIENAVKEGFATWKYAIIAAAGLIIIGVGVVGLIIFMRKKKKASDASKRNIWPQNSKLQNKIDNPLFRLKSEVDIWPQLNSKLQGEMDNPLHFLIKAEKDDPFDSENEFKW